VFGEDNFVTEILVKKKGSQKSSALDPVNDFILWYSRLPRSEGVLKIRNVFEARKLDSETVDEFSRAELTDGKIVNLKKYMSFEGEELDFHDFPGRIAQEFPGARLFRPWPITNGGERPRQMDPVTVRGVPVSPPKNNCWRHTSRAEEGELSGMGRLLVADRLIRSRTALDYIRYLDDFPYKTISNWWDGFGGAPDQVYVVQTNEGLVERCILMTTDPGDLVLDPTCGSGTTAYVAEQWGRRWITIDTSRVALALARARIRVAGPFTIESLSPHRVVAVDQDDNLIRELAEPAAGWEDFGQMVLENLKTAGVQQAHKEDRITFTALMPWPGKLISADGRYSDGEQERRAALLVGPEFGIVSRPDLVNAAREAADAGFDVVIACAFNFDARSAELDRIGRIPILKARMNPDLHMAGELKNTGAGNLFVVFGEPDIDIEPVGTDRIQVKIKASMSSSRRPARSSPAAPTRSRCGSSTPTTTRRAFLSAMRIFSAPRPTPTRR
jgi:hypothetical protein